jgi:segregation and condensation protein B
MKDPTRKRGSDDTRAECQESFNDATPFDEMSLLEAEFATHSDADRDRTTAAAAVANAAAGRDDASVLEQMIALEAGRDRNDASTDEALPPDELGCESAELVGAPSLETAVEAVLFAAAAPLPLNRLAKLLVPWKRTQIQEALGRLGENLERGERGVRLVETGAGFQLRSVPSCASWVRRVDATLSPRLSRPTLETLAIVAYRQPATRGEIEAIRGVNCDAVLGALIARRLIEVVGRRQSAGRPVEYGTTVEFLELFSLRDLAELPPLPDAETLADLATPSDSFMEDSVRDGAVAEDPEPVGHRLAADRGGPDPLGTGEGEREGGARARSQGGSDEGPGER